MTDFELTIPGLKSEVIRDLKKEFVNEYKLFLSEGVVHVIHHSGKIGTCLIPEDIKTVLIECTYLPWEKVKQVWQRLDYQTRVELHDGRELPVILPGINKAKLNAKYHKRFTDLIVE